MNDIRLNRREAIGLAGAVLAGCSARGEVAPEAGPRAGAVIDPARVDSHGIRWAPANELVNTMEFEEQAQRVLSPELFAEIMGGDREPLNRVTFRPRMNVPTLDMDLGAEVLGQTLFTPLVLGPIDDAGRYHEEGEAGLVRGAAEAHTSVIISSRARVPLASLVAQTELPVWFGVHASDGDSGDQARSGEAAGAKALFITAGRRGQTAVIDWDRVESIRQGIRIPVVIRGIRTPSEAVAAVTRGYQGVVVEAAAQGGTGGSSLIDALPAVADALEQRIALLAEGGFRRGADIVKGLAFGADAVLMRRPAAWALAAYGADGVHSLLQLVHEELARNFGMLGVSTPRSLTRDHIEVHRFATT